MLKGKCVKIFYRKTCTLFFVAALSLSATVSAQEKRLRKSAVGISFGLSRYRVQDQVFSPLTYGGISVPVQFDYLFDGDKTQHRIVLSHDNTELTSAITQSYSGATNFVKASFTNLSYTFQKRMNWIRDERDFSIYLGGTLKNFLSVKNYHFIRSSSELSLDYFSSLNISLQLSKKINKKSHLRFLFNYPVVAYVVGRMRNPRDLPNKEALNESIENGEKINPLDIATDGDLLWLNKFIDWENQFVYRYSLSQRWYLSAAYLFRFYQYDKLSSIQFGNHRLLVGISLKL